MVMVGLLTLVTSVTGRPASSPSLFFSVSGPGIASESGTSCGQSATGSQNARVWQSSSPRMRPSAAREKFMDVHCPLDGSSIFGDQGGSGKRAVLGRVIRKNRGLLVVADTAGGGADSRDVGFLGNRRAAAGAGEIVSHRDDRAFLGGYRRVEDLRAERRSIGLVKQADVGSDQRRVYVSGELGGDRVEAEDVEVAVAEHSARIVEADQGYGFVLLELDDGVLHHRLGFSRRAVFALFGGCAASGGGNARHDC